MKTSNCAIVLLYRGEVANEQIVQELKSVLVDNKITIPELLSITVMDEKGIAEATLGKTSIINDFVEEESAQNAIDNAIIFIGEHYKEYLAGASHLTMFAIRLAQDINTARMSDDKKYLPLLKAVEIISTKEGIVNKKYAKKYGFNSSVVAIIKRIYTPY